MGSIYQRIHLKQRGSENEKIYPWIDDITNEKAQNTEHCGSPLNGDKTDGVIDVNESHPISVSYRGQTKTRNFLAMEGGWY